MCKQALKAENNLHHIWLTKAERVEKLLAERDVGSARFQEVVATLRRITKAREKTKDKADDILTKVVRLYE